MIGEGGAYGAARAGENFHPIKFLKHPRTILRLTSLIFSIVVFGCIASQSHDKNNKCIFGEDDSACNFGSAIGILGLVILTLFIAVDIMFPNISSVHKRKKIILADIGFSGLWAILYFIGFCYLTSTWASPNHHGNNGYGANNARAAIAFSFFSIGTWAGLAYLALKSLKEGTTSTFNFNIAELTPESSTPYTSFPGVTEMSSPSKNWQNPLAANGAKNLTNLHSVNNA